MKGKTITFDLDEFEKALDKEGGKEYTTKPYMGQLRVLPDGTLVVSRHDRFNDDGNPVFVKDTVLTKGKIESVVDDLGTCCMRCCGKPAVAIVKVDHSYDGCKLIYKRKYCDEHIWDRQNDIIEVIKTTGEFEFIKAWTRGKERE